MDGTVKCFTGGHVALALFAVLVLTSCVVLIVVVMAITVGKLKVRMFVMVVVVHVSQNLLIRFVLQWILNLDKMTRSIRIIYH